MKKTLLLLAILALSIKVFASTDEKIELPDTSIHLYKKLNPSDAYNRTQSVLNYFKVPAEKDPQAYLDGMGPNYSASEIKSRYKWFDASGTFQKFIEILGPQLNVYRDIESRSVNDFNFQFGRVSDRPSLRDRILSAKNTNPPHKILTGLRIALDPGHMGGTYWDKITGKYVSDGKRTVSEGVINLQTCLLLKTELEKLGAQVLITHDDFVANSNLDYKSFDVTPFARQELRYLSLESWFQALLGTAPAGPTLNKNFENNANVKKLFSSSSRNQYFVKRADLDARVDLMAAFNPDITIYVHHDTAGDDGISPKSPNKTRAFVPGSFGATELANRASRKYIARHLLDKEAWDLSLQMIRSTLKHLNTRMGLPAATSDGEETVKVENGIFARNLHVPRKMKNTVTAYWEMFFYDRPQEFAALLDYKYTMQINGKNSPYSERLRQSVISLRDGLVDFVKAAN